jgi:hypothetical protein
MRILSLNCCDDNRARVGDFPGKIYAAASCHRADDSDDLPLPLFSMGVRGTGALRERFKTTFEAADEHSNASPRFFLRRLFLLFERAATAFMWSMVDDWGVFLREAREAGPKTLLLLLLLLFEVYRVPLLCKSHALSLSGTSVGCVVRRSWACGPD